MMMLITFKWNLNGFTSSSSTDGHWPSRRPTWPQLFATPIGIIWEPSPIGIIWEPSPIGIIWEPWDPEGSGRLRCQQSPGVRGQPIAGHPGFAEQFLISRGIQRWKCASATTWWCLVRFAVGNAFAISKATYFFYYYIFCTHIDNVKVWCRYRE